MKQRPINLKPWLLSLALINLSACDGGSSEDDAASNSPSSFTQTTQSGVAGQQGPIGPQGPQGIQGEMGPQGVPGSFEAFDAPVRISVSDISKLTEAQGLLVELPENADYAFANYRVQLYQAETSCASANLEMKWPGGNWLQVRHFFVERNRGDSHGAGSSFSGMVPVIDQARLRIRENINGTCPTFDLYLGGYNEGGVQNFDWAYFPVR